MQVVAIATSKRELVVVDEKGQAFELDMERNFKIKIPPKAFREQTTVSSLVFIHNIVQICFLKFGPVTM